MTLLALSAALLGATALIACAALGVRSPAPFAVGVYVLVWAQVVALTETLSLFEQVDSRGYLIGEAGLFILALAAWLIRGRPLFRVPELRLARARRHPLVAALLGLVVASLGFQAFLVAGTPPNNNDSMAYHLPRAAEWHQRGAVERYPTYFEPQNAYPPNGEIGILHTFSFLDRDTLAAAPQLLARIALLAAVYGLARQASFGRAASAFASLVFSSLTLVVVQAVTTQNDLIVASFVAAAALLAIEALRGNPRTGPLAGLAAGLAAGTKWTGAAAVILLALIVVAVSRDRRRLAPLIAWAAAGFAAVGMAGYLRNLDATGNPLGEVSELPGVETSPTLSEVVTTAYRLVLDFGDFSSYFRNANEDTSYFGTLGWALILPLCAAFGAAWILRRTSSLRGAFAFAVPLFVLILALTHPYDRFSGRLLILAVALASPLVAWTYRRRLLAAPVTALAATSLVLAIVFNEAKPVGLAAGLRPVWELPRIAAQTLKNPPMAEVVSTIESRVPASGRLGAVLEGQVWSYPLYGTSLEGDVVYLEPEGAFADAQGERLRWVVFSDRRLVGEAPAGWLLESLGSSGWVLATRTRQ